jgi:predicted DNA-binding transcriptional regulator AlpA
MSAHPDPQTPPRREPLVSVPELAHQLGVSVHAVKRWTAAGPKSGKVPTMRRINGQIRFRQEDIDKWIDEQEIK